MIKLSMQESKVKIFLKLIKHPVKFRIFLFYKIPSAWFSGIRILAVTEVTSTVAVPYNWATKNPFRSTYFACLAMAAEMSTGILAMMNIYKRQPAVSMLVVDMQAVYFKKAIGTTIFVCDEGSKISQIIQQTIDTNTSKTILVKSTGRNTNGELIAEFKITWSFKKKNK